MKLNRYLYACACALLIPLVACKTTGAGTADSATASDESEGGPVLVTSGPTANAIYYALDVEEVTEGAATVKRVSGNLALDCRKSPGAQGTSEPTQYFCWGTENDADFTQGSPTFLSIYEDFAKEMFDSFRTPARWDDALNAYVKLWSGPSSWVCRKLGTHATCRFARGLDGGSGNGGDSPADGSGGGSSLLSLGGSGANAAYAAMRLERMTVPGGEMKQHQGRISVYCRQEGALPPGAQGFPGPMTYQCIARVPLPPGAQGFPPPPFMVLEGEGAMRFWEAFHVQSQWGFEAYEKVFESQHATFVCRKIGSTATCELREGT